MTKVSLIPLLLAACTGQVVADATLTYELTGPNDAGTTKTLAIARFFARVDDSAKPDSYLLYQAGKFFPLYEVNPAEKAYTRLTPKVKPTLKAGARPAAGEGPESGAVSAAGATSVARQEASAEAGSDGETGDLRQPDEASTPPTGGPAEPGQTAKPLAEQTGTLAEKPAQAASVPSRGEPPASAKTAAGAEAAAQFAEQPAPPVVTPALRASREKREIAGIECRVVEELRDGEPVREHCMANKAQLGITEREVRTLARTFKMARERNLGWLGAATADENFVSVEVVDPASGTRLVLQQVSTTALPQGHLKIPREYKQTNP
jgi:hypothetical protein